MAFRCAAMALLLAALLVLAPTAGASSFVPAPGSPFPVGSGPFSVATGDFDGDGDPDLVTANVTGGPEGVSVLLNDGGGSFSRSPTGSGHPRDVSVGDVDGDGADDLVLITDEPLVANQAGIPDTLSVLLGDGGGGFGSPIVHLIGPQPNSVAMGEFDGDGNVDLAITNTVFWLETFENEVVILRGRGTGHFDPGGRVLDRVSPYPFEERGVTFGDGPTAIEVADFDGDAEDDFAFVNTRPRNISVWLGDGAGGFGAAPGSPVPMPHGAAPFSLAAGDLDGDGATDLVAGHFSFSVAGSDVSAAALLGDGNGAFTTAPGSPFATGALNAVGVAIGDFDADGRPDLATTNGGEVSVLSGDGRGAFTRVPGSPFPAGSPRGIVAADFNGDGRDDIAAANPSSDDVTVLLSVSDTTAPTTIATVSPGPNAAGWNREDVMVHLTSADGPGGSGVREIEYVVGGEMTVVPGGRAAVPVDAEGVTEISYRGIGNAGGAEVWRTLVVRIDKTAPAVAIRRDPAPNSEGWNNADVTVVFEASDDLSGMDGASSAEVVFSGEGAGQTASRHFTDRAGNPATGTVAHVNIDKTPPEAILLYDPDRQDVAVLGRDHLSGPRAGTSPFAVLSDDDEGVTRRRYVVGDRAGNEFLPVARVERRDDDGQLDARLEGFDANKFAIAAAEGVLEQKIELGTGAGKRTWKAVYDGGGTKITVARDGRRTTERRSGLVLLRLVTSGPTLTVEY